MENDFKAPELIHQLKNRLHANRPLMASIAETMRVAVLKNFETEGARLGEPWQDLAHSTRKQRQQQGYWPGKKLQRTGQLKRSIASSYGDNYARVSTNVVYAAIQNYGGVIHRSSLKTFIRKKREGKAAKQPKSNKMSSIRIPARPFMKLNDQDLEKIKSTIINALTKNG